MKGYDYFKEKDQKNNVKPTILRVVQIMLIIMLILKIVAKDNLYDVLALFSSMQCVESFYMYSHFKHKEDVIAFVAMMLCSIALWILYIVSLFNLY